MGQDLDVSNLARLARLGLTEGERALFAEQIQHLLGYINCLQKVDLTGVEPLTHVLQGENAWQEDQPGVPFEPGKALQNAPQQREHQLVVPKVVE